MTLAKAGGASPDRVAIEAGVAKRRLHRRDTEPALARGAPEPLAVPVTVEGSRREQEDGAVARRLTRVSGQRRDPIAPAGEHADPGQARHDTPSSTSAALQPPNPSEVDRLTRVLATRGTPIT